MPNVLDAATHRLDLRFIEVDKEWQEAGPLRFRAVAVDHVPHLECFGFLFERPGQTIGYSGDTKPCAGLDELASSSDVLIVECNGTHANPPVPITHMDITDVRALRRRYPTVPFILTHLGEEPDPTELPNTTAPSDFESITIPSRPQRR